MTGEIVGTINRIYDPFAARLFSGRLSAFFAEYRIIRVLLGNCIADSVFYFFVCNGYWAAIGFGNYTYSLVKVLQDDPGSSSDERKGKVQLLLVAFCHDIGTQGLWPPGLF